MPLYSILYKMRHFQLHIVSVKIQRTIKSRPDSCRRPRLSRPAEVPKGTFPEYKIPPGSHPAPLFRFCASNKRRRQEDTIVCRRRRPVIQIHYADNLSFRPFFPPCFLIRFCLPPSPFCSIRIIIPPPRIRINAVRITAASVQPQQESLSTYSAAIHPGSGV